MATTFTVMSQNLSKTETVAYLQKILSNANGMPRGTSEDAKDNIFENCIISIDGNIVTLKYSLPHGECTQVFDASNIENIQKPSETGHLNNVGIYMNYKNVHAVKITYPDGHSGYVGICNFPFDISDTVTFPKL